VLTDARGVPIGIAIGGANVHDTKLLAATLVSIPVKRPRPTKRRKQHLCLDKAYHGQPCQTMVCRCRYTPHIRSRGEEHQACKKGQKARRWVVEGAHSWTNRARRLLVRWEKKDENYLAFIHLRFAYVALKRAGVLG
jgi:putative transposase